MKRSVLTVGACFSFFILAIPTTPSVQIRDMVAKKVQPYINSATQNWSWMAIDLVLNGKNLPPKTGSGNIRRLIRLLSMGSGVEGTKGSAFFMGQLGNWTPVVISDLIPIEIVVGRKYRIGLVEFDEFNPSVKNLISNQVELFIRMNLDQVTPNPVPYGTTEVEVTTTNWLGPRGAKIIKLGNLSAPVTQWTELNNTKFKISIPKGPTWPGTYELFVEENGSAVSRKIQLQLLGAKIK